MPPEGEELLPAVRIPDFHGLVPAPRNDALAVAAETRAHDGMRVSLERLKFLPAVSVPDLQGFVLATRDEVPAVAAETHTADRARVPANRLDESFIPGVP